MRRSRGQVVLLGLVFTVAAAALIAVFVGVAYGLVAWDDVAGGY
jgi:hypothetical protein